MLSLMQPSDPILPPAIGAAVNSLATATVRLETAKAALAAAQKSAVAVRSRIAALDAERAAIVQRRAAGLHEEGDAGRLALIAADLDGLAPLVAEADAAASAARSTVQAEEHLVANAHAELARAEAEAQLVALVAHAQKLDTLMVTTLAQIAEVAARIGAPGRPPWAPTPGLVLAVRRHAAAHGLL